MLRRVRFDLEPYGPALISRARGAGVRVAVLGVAGDAAAVILDFRGITHASYSFIDEVYGELLTMHTTGRLLAGITVANAVPAIRSHVTICARVRAPRDPIPA